MGLFVSKVNHFFIYLTPGKIRKLSKLKFISQIVVFFYFLVYFHGLLEKTMASHSSTLTWKIPWTEEPGGLQSMGSRRVGNDFTFTFCFPALGCMWRRKWQPTPVFLPGESQGRGSLVGCRLWGRTESDTTEATQQQQQQQQGMTKNLGGRAKLLTAPQDSTKLCVCV